MWLGLIPVSHSSDVIGQGLIFPTGPPAQGLNGYLQVFFKMYGIHHVPAVKPVAGNFSRLQAMQGIAEEMGLAGG